MTVSNDRLVQWVCSGNTVVWHVQERYRGGLNWIFEEVRLSVGWWYFFLGLKSTCVDKGWSGCEKEMQR